MCLQGPETTIHFLLKCPIFNIKRRELFGKINIILNRHGLSTTDDHKMVHLLLYGDENFTLLENKNVLNAIIKFIEKIGCFDQV